MDFAIGQFVTVTFSSDDGCSGQCSAGVRVVAGVRDRAAGFGLCYAKLPAIPRTIVASCNDFFFATNSFYCVVVFFMLWLCRSVPLRCVVVSRPRHLLDRRSPAASKRVASSGDLRSDGWSGRETWPQRRRATWPQPSRGTWPQRRRARGDGRGTVRAVVSG